MKVLLVGFDGLDPEILLKYKQDLPNFENLIKRGSFGKFDSIQPPNTGGGWVSIFTGLNPGKTCALGFMKRKGYDFSINTVSSRKIWNIISENGSKIGLINIPFPGPPEKLSEFSISGRFTNFQTYPKKLKKKIFDKGYFLDFPELKKYKNIEDYKEAVFKQITDRTMLALDLYKRFNIEFYVIVYSSPDILHHFIDREEDVLELYKRIDNAIGDLNSIDTDLTIIVSDHGFSQQSIKGTFYFSEWLKKKGYLRLKTLPAKKGLFSAENLYKILKSVGLDGIQKSIPIGIRNKLYRENPHLFQLDIDWKRSVAFCEPNFPALYFNMRGREPFGIVEEGVRFEELKRMLKGEIEALSDGEGENLNIKVWDREELYWGDRINELPELIFSIPERYNFVDKLNDGNIFGNEKVWERVHTYKSTFIISGKNVLEGKYINGSIYDIAPSILYLMGLPIPKDMDGRVLVEVINPDIVKNNPPMYENRIKDNEEKAQLTKEDEGEMLKRLKDLGYL